MVRHRTPESDPTPLDFDSEAAFEKAIVRLVQASQPVPESFPALRVAAVLFQIAGVATLATGVFGAVVLGRSHLDDALGFPAEYLSVVLGVICAGAALRLFVVRDLLTIQLAVARNARLMTVLLAEMNFADRGAVRHGLDQSGTNAPIDGRPDDATLSLVMDQRARPGDDPVAGTTAQHG